MTRRFRTCLLSSICVLLAAQPGLAERGRPTTHPATRPVVQADGKFKLWFRNTPAIDVLDYYAEASGNAVVLEQQVSGRLSILVDQPITAEEALKLIQIALKPLGYDADLRGKTVVIRTHDRIKKLT
jgi:hypothetical protein